MTSYIYTYKKVCNTWPDSQKPFVCDGWIDHFGQSQTSQTIGLVFSHHKWMSFGYLARLCKSTCISYMKLLQNIIPPLCPLELTTNQSPVIQLTLASQQILQYKQFRSTFRIPHQCFVFWISMEFLAKI